MQPAVIKEGYLGAACITAAARAVQPAVIKEGYPGAACITAAARAVQAAVIKEGYSDCGAACITAAAQALALAQAAVIIRLPQRRLLHHRRRPLVVQHAVIKEEANPGAAKSPAAARAFEALAAAVREGLPSAA